MKCIFMVEWHTISFKMRSLMNKRQAKESVIISMEGFQIYK